MDYVNFNGSERIIPWKQDSALRKVGCRKGMCIVFAFYFGARHMLHMDWGMAIEETKNLSEDKGYVILKALKTIYDNYTQAHGNFYDEIFNIAIQCEASGISESLTYDVTGYDHFDKKNELFYHGKGLHEFAAGDLKDNYFDILKSNKFLMIGTTMSSGEKHAMTLLYEPTNDSFILFDPNFGWYQITDIFLFMNDYGKKLNVIEWDFVIVSPA